MTAIGATSVMMECPHCHENLEIPVIMNLVPSADRHVIGRIESLLDEQFISDHCATHHETKQEQR